MKKIWILTLTIFAAGFSFSAENSADRLYYKKVVEKEPSRTQETGTVKKESTGEKIVSAIESAPQMVDSISALLDKAPETAQKITTAVENLSPKKSHLYLRINVTEPDLERGKRIFPGAGLGYRRTVGNAAVDFSAGYSQGRRGHGKSEFITLPKISYLYYFSPTQSQSLYIGPAVALGRIKREHGNRFEGLIASASLGYELSRRANMLSFFQLDVSLPLVAANLKGPFPSFLGELAFGIGF